MPTMLVRSSNVVETAAANRLMILTGHAPATIPPSTVPGQVAIPFLARASASEGNDKLVFSVGSKLSVVVYPTSTDDVVKIVKYRMPVIPYSGATSLTLPSGTFSSHCSRFLGLTIPPQPSVAGICVDMLKMNRMIEIHGVSCRV